MINPKIEDKHNPLLNSIQKCLEKNKRGAFKLQDIADKDHTPLLFILDDNKTYEKKCAKED